ncbi:hypothetical protein PMAYCL1PPCAC_15688, partial [Pristionchus mayeri]
KTGTLTQNKMILRRCATVDSECAVGVSSCSAPDCDTDFVHLLNNMICCNTVFVQTGRRRDVIDDQDTPQVNDVYSVGAPSSYAFSESDLMDEELRLQGFVDLHYEGESPDELALVRGARRFGFHLTARSNNFVTFVGPDKKPTKLEVLCTLPFDNVRKRMSVCVVGENEDEVIVYSKGADFSMLGVAGKRAKRNNESALRDIQEDEEEEEDDEDRPLKPSREDVIRSRVDEYARMGLRTLVMGMRVMRRNEFDEWLRIQKQVELTRGDEETERMLSELAQRIETPTRVIGVTAVEDKLQENVEMAIASLREAQIQVWVLTGDKKETAEGVATACGLFRNIPVHFESESKDTYAGMDVVVSPEHVTEMCLPLSSALDRLDGCCSVLCYRLTPGQKAEIVKAVKRRGGVVAAIGDGANDVPMIQAAHVGIGISGNEGSQASMAADFVLAQFSFVSRLILLHGHWNYARIANVMLYFFYKNIQNVMIAFFIQLYNGWSCGFPVNMLYSVCYPVIFTRFAALARHTAINPFIHPSSHSLIQTFGSLQPIIFGVLDQDRREKELLADSSLYGIGRDGTLYNVRHFLFNIADAVWQAAVCYGTVHVLNLDSRHSNEYFGFCLASAMFITNMAHLILETHCINAHMILIHFVGAFLTYSFFLSYDIIPTDELYSSEDAMGDFSFYAAMLVATIVCLIPRFLIRVLLVSDAQVRLEERAEVSELSCL